MQTSLIVYPRADKFIRVHTSMLFLCEGNQTAAALISFLEGWHNYQFERIEYDKLFNKMLADNEQPPIIEVNGWQYHTDEQLEKGVMIAKRDTIARAAVYLETKNFISTDVPDHLRMFHKTGRTKWFLLMVDQINTALRKLEAKQARLLGIPAPPVIEKKASKPKPEIEPDADLDTILGYYNLARRKTAKLRGVTVINAKGTTARYSLMIDRLKERSIAEICLAISGYMKSSWHQGQNDRQKVYDSLELILRDNEHIENGMTLAVNNGVTLDAVKRFLNGDKVLPSPKQPKYLVRDIATRLTNAILSNKTSIDLDRLPPSIYSVVLREVTGMIERQVGMFTEDHKQAFESLTNAKNTA